MCTAGPSSATQIKDISIELVLIICRQDDFIPTDSKKFMPN